jgi:hypothetical protein
LLVGDEGLAGLFAVLLLAMLCCCWLCAVLVAWRVDGPMAAASIGPIQKFVVITSIKNLRV